MLWVSWVCTVNRDTMIACDGKIWFALDATRTIRNIFQDLLHSPFGNRINACWSWTGISTWFAVSYVIGKCCMLCFAHLQSEHQRWMAFPEELVNDILNRSEKAIPCLLLSSWRFVAQFSSHIYLSLIIEHDPRYINHSPGRQSNGMLLWWLLWYGIKRLCYVQKHQYMVWFSLSASEDQWRSIVFSWHPSLRRIRCACGTLKRCLPSG